MLANTQYYMSSNSRQLLVTVMAEEFYGIPPHSIKSRDCHWQVKIAIGASVPSLYNRHQALLMVLGKTDQMRIVVTRDC